MNIISILGVLGTLLGLIRALPQLVTLIRAGRAAGVSVDAAATSSIVSFGWAVYGLLTHQPYVSLATGSSGIIFLLITLSALKYGRKVREFKVAPFWFCVILLAGIWAGKTGLGIILPISVLAANTPQLLIAYRESNLADLSLGTWLLCMADGLVWGMYSLIQQDNSIMVYGFFQLITSTLIIFLKLLYAARKSKQAMEATEEI